MNGSEATEHADAAARTEVAASSSDAATDIATAKAALEAALLTAQEAMSLNELRRLFDDDIGADIVRRLLDEIRADWSQRGVELVNVASGWRFRTRPEMQRFLDRLNPQKPPKYSRAVLETLAIVAYRQPVTRGDIEDIRGVTVSTNIVKALETRGWIEVIGHREVPGRPALYATTRQFLDDLGLRSVEELPPLEDLGALIETESGNGVPGLALAPAHGTEEPAAVTAAHGPPLPAGSDPDAQSTGARDEAASSIDAAGVDEGAARADYADAAADDAAHKRDPAAPDVDPERFATAAVLRDRD